MDLIEKIAAYRSGDSQTRKDVADSRNANIKRILEIRSNRGRGYANSSTSYNNFNEKDNKKKIVKKMKQPMVAGKDFDVRAMNNSTGNYYINDKIERFERAQNPEYERNLNSKFRENSRNNLSKARLDLEKEKIKSRENLFDSRLSAIEKRRLSERNSVFRGTPLASSRPKALATLAAGGLGSGLLGYGLGHLGGDSPEELDALHQQAQDIQANDNYKLPLAIGAGTLGAAYMLGDKNDRRRMTNGREYNPYS